MAAPEQKSVVLAPSFKLALLSVIGLTLLSLVVMVVMAITNAENDASKDLLTTCSTTFKMGFGAVVGLLGGKLSN
jgi:hypothetical protein